MYYHTDPDLYKITVKSVTVSGMEPNDSQDELMAQKSQLNYEKEWIFFLLLLVLMWSSWRSQKTTFWHEKWNIQDKSN